MSTPATIERCCRACQTPLARKPEERNSNWVRRTVCNEKCRLAILCKRLRELDAQRVEVACVCGAKVMRSARYKHSKAVRCYTCMDTMRQAKATQRREGKRLEASRYRILMTILGWDDFGELIDYLRTVPWATVDGRRVRGLRGSA